MLFLEGRKVFIAIAISFLFATIGICGSKIDRTFNFDTIKIIINISTANFYLFTLHRVINLHTNIKMEKIAQIEEQNAIQTVYKNLDQAILIIDREDKISFMNA